MTATSTPGLYHGACAKSASPTADQLGRPVIGLINRRPRATPKHRLRRIAVEILPPIVTNAVRGALRRRFSGDATEWEYRPDGWPQVTTVGYVNDGLNLYFVTGRESQKLANLKADSRVSLSIHTVAAIEGAVGVSMAGHAHEVTDPAQVELHLPDGVLLKTYPSTLAACRTV